jgi:polar amino acid transport system permease protein
MTADVERRLRHISAGLAPARAWASDPGWILVLGSATLVWALATFKPDPFRRIFFFLLDGVLVTFQLTIISFLFILLVGLIGGVGRIVKNPVMRGLASLYVEIVRGIPLMVQLLFIWFALPQVLDFLGQALLNRVPSLGQALIELSFSPFVAAVTGLTICYGAYMSEIVRAGIESIPHGQMEAARSLGMSYVQAMRYVILPQALRVVLPPSGNEFVALLKDSALVSVLAVSDLTRRGREYMARTFLSLETWAMVALIYLVLTLFFARIVALIEKKMDTEEAR